MRKYIDILNEALNVHHLKPVNYWYSGDDPHCWELGCPEYGVVCFIQQWGKSFEWMTPAEHGNHQRGAEDSLDAAKRAAEQAVGLPPCQERIGEAINPASAMPKTPICPACGNDGSDGGIYLTADLRWNGQYWIISQYGDGAGVALLECLRCSHTWDLEDSNISNLPSTGEQLR